MNAKVIFIFISSISLNFLFVASSNPNKQNVSSVKIDYDYDYVNETEIDTIDSNCFGNTFFDKFSVQHRLEKRDQFVKNVKSINETIDILNNLGNVFNSLFGLSKWDKQKLIELIVENDFGLSAECSAAYYRIYHSFNNFDAWALKIVDSIGSFPPSGFAEGVFADFGEYDECLAVQSPDDRRLPAIDGKYCVSKMILPFPAIDLSDQNDQNKTMKTNPKFSKIEIFNYFEENDLIRLLNMVNGTIFQLGICIPSVCESIEVQDMLNKIFYPVLRLPIEVLTDCHTKEQTITLDNYQKVSITILSILVICVIFCTAFVLLNDTKLKKTAKPMQFLQCFSLIENTKALFRTSNKFQALDTMRLLLILNVHIVHTYLFTPSLGLKTIKKVISDLLPRLFNDWRYFFVKSPLMIDALFTLSGFLIAYSLMKKLHQTRGRFNYLLYLFQQWTRFVIIVFGSILFYFVFPLFNSGPVWDTGVDLLTTGCRNPFNLVKILLFINNFQEFEISKFNATCNVTLWFMSSLYQFTVISPMFIILYYKRPRVGKYVLGMVLIVALLSTISPFLLFGIRPWVQRLSNGYSFLTSRLNDSINWFHTTPNNHAFSYFVGISFGLLMDKNFLLSRFCVRLLWFLSVTGISIVYYWNNTFWHIRDTEPQTSALLWLTLGKAIYSMSFGWIYFSCCTGRGGIFNKIFSWKGFQPITRLSFGIYLLHYMIVIRRIFNVKQTSIINDRLMMGNLTIDFILDIIIAYVFYILIECPFSNIFQIVFGKTPIKTTTMFLEAVNNQNKLINTENQGSP